MNVSDPRVIRTKKMFKEAFKELFLLNATYSDINVKKICEKAGLSRGTFYLHYQQIDDVLTEIQNEAIAEFLSRIAQCDIFRDVKQVVIEFFDMNESSQYYQKMALAYDFDFIREISLNKLAKIMKNNAAYNYLEKYGVFEKMALLHFYHTTLLNVYKDWIRKNRPISKEDAIELAYQLISNGVHNVG